MIEDFVFKGFEPNDKTQRLAKRRYERMFSTVPSDSTPRAFIEKNSQGFQGTVKVESSHLSMTVEANGVDPDQVIEDLFQNLQDRLSSWRRMRFA